MGLKQADEIRNPSVKSEREKIGIKSSCTRQNRTRCRGIFQICTSQEDISSGHQNDCHLFHLGRRRCILRGQCHPWKVGGQHLSELAWRRPTMMTILAAVRYQLRRLAGPCHGGMIHFRIPISTSVRKRSGLQHLPMHWVGMILSNAHKTLFPLNMAVVTDTPDKFFRHADLEQRSFPR